MEKEREGKGEGRKRGRRRGGGEKMKGIVIGGMVLFLLFSCNNGVAELEKRNSFYESVVKIGQGFQEIFGIFGNVFRFNVVKSGDNRSKVGEHFEKVKKGLGDTNGKLKELSTAISSTSNANGDTIKIVVDTIKGASDVLEQLIGALTKLADVTKEGTPIGDTASASAAVAADTNDVKIIIDNIKKIVEVAKNSEVKIEEGKDGNAVSSSGATDAGAALGGHSAAASDQSGPKLSDEVEKSDPWAIINKIKNANMSASPAGNNNNEVGALIKTTSGTASVGAKTNADFVAAVALKAMTKTGKLSAAANEVVGVKAAGVSAVNKVLGVLDEVIRRTVNSHLEKIRKAVEGLKYSEATGEATEAKK